MAKSTGHGKNADPNEKTICQNRRARYEYEILDELECGIVLTGSEVKTLRDNKGSLEDAYARITNDELWLIGCDIPQYPQANIFNHEPKRNRKLLIHKRELLKFAAQAAFKGFTLVPLAMYFTKGKVKIKLAVARGKQLHDKREAMKTQAAVKEMRQQIASRKYD